MLFFKCHIRTTHQRFKYWQPNNKKVSEIKGILNEKDDIINDLTVRGIIDEDKKNDLGKHIDVCSETL